MTTSLVAAYRKGAITADHLVVRCLQLIDPEDPGPILDPLPPDLAHRLLEFARQYRTGRMVTNYGNLPTPDQVEAAKRWIEGNHGRVDRGSQLPILDEDRNRPGFHAAPEGPGSSPVGNVHKI